MKLKPRYPIGRGMPFGATPVDLDGTDVGTLTAEHGSGWKGGGSWYDFRPNDAGKARGLKTVLSERGMRATLAKASEA